MEKKTEPAPLPVPEPVKTNSVEIGGAKRDSEATRYGDWEINGKCVDF